MPVNILPTTKAEKNAYFIVPSPKASCINLVCLWGFCKMLSLGDSFINNNYLFCSVKELHMENQDFTRS